MKKLRIQPSFASLTEAELEQLACDLQRETFAAVLERVRKPRSEGGLDLNFSSKSPLERLLGKKHKLDLLNARLRAQGGEHKKLTLAEFSAITSGDSGPCGESHPFQEVHDAILGVTYDLVTNGENTPHQLLALQRLADFPVRAELRAQTAAIQAERHEFARAKEQRAQEMHGHKITMDLARKEFAQQRLGIQQRRITLAEKLGEKKLAASSPSAIRGVTAVYTNQVHSDSAEPSRPCDALGPLARNWAEVGDRVCKQFGITREELIRRAELRRTWKNPNDFRNAPAPAPHPKCDAEHVTPASSSFAAQAHEESSVPISGGVTASVTLTPDSPADSNHECSHKQEPAPLRDITVETNNPTAPTSIPATPLAALAAHNEQFFKAIAARAAAALNALNAGTTQAKPENENQTTNH